MREKPVCLRHVVPELYCLRSDAERGLVMGFLELFCVAVGLSMDAFAVAICKGLQMRRLRPLQGGVIALFFGGFQALMPLIGWFLGNQFARTIASLDHWIAFVLLGVIGAKMIFDAYQANGGAEDVASDRFDLREIFVLAVATSIDALAVGVTFAFLQVGIFGAITLIGATTFLLSFAGVLIGHKFGIKYEKKAQILGGVILTGIGCKILLSHLGLLPF